MVYRVEEASSADFSNPVTFSQEQNLVDSQVLNDGTFELLTVRGNTALTDDTQSFLRLRVRESTRIVPAPRSVGFPDLAITSLINLDFTDPLRSDDRYYIKEYVLEPQDVGRVIHFTLRSDDFDAFLQLIDADTGALLESDDNGGGGLDSEIVLTVAAGVNYLFRVSSSIPEELGEFSLASFRVIVLTPLGLPETVNTNFNTLDDTDPLFPRDTFYKDDFVLTGVAPGTAIKITQTSPDWGDVDPFLTIINGETNQVLFREDDSGVGFDATLSFVVKPNTTYHVRASTAIADQVGVYTLKTVFAPTISKDNITVNGALAASDETDPLFVDNDNPNDPFYKDDYLLIGAQAGDMVTVEYTSTSIDPFLAIINAEDGLLALADELCAGISCIDDIGEANLNARLTFEVQDGVTYLIRASSASVEETGAYAIRAFISP